MIFSLFSLYVRPTEADSTELFYRCGCFLLLVSYCKNIETILIDKLPPPHHTHHAGRPLPWARGCLWACRCQETRHVSVSLRRAGEFWRLLKQHDTVHLQLPGPHRFSPDFLSWPSLTWPGTVSWVLCDVRARDLEPCWILKTFAQDEAKKKKRHHCLSDTAVGVWRGRKQRSLRVVRKSHSEFCTYRIYCFLSLGFILQVAAGGYAPEDVSNVGLSDLNVTFKTGQKLKELNDDWSLWLWPEAAAVTKPDFRWKQSREAEKMRDSYMTT